MTSVGARHAGVLLTLTLLSCSTSRLQSNPSPAGDTPTSTPPQLPVPTLSPLTGEPVGEQPSTGGLFHPRPATDGGGGASATTAATPAVDRTDSASVARAYATGIYTVDWTRPLPGAQKLAATSPWATPSAAAKLARGQHYQPPRTDPRVAASHVDAVERVVVEEADPVPGGAAYLATIDIRTSSTHGVSTTRAFLLITVIRQAGGWLVDDSQVVG